MLLCFLLSIWVKKKLWLLFILHLSYSGKFENFWVSVLFWSSTIFGIWFYACHLIVKCPKEGKTSYMWELPTVTSSSLPRSLAHLPFPFPLPWLPVMQVCRRASKYLSSGIILSRMESFVWHWASFSIKGTIAPTSESWHEDSCKSPWRWCLTLNS